MWLALNERVNLRNTGSVLPKGQFNPRSYVSAVNGKVPLNVPRAPNDSIPTLVLDDSCVIERDLSRHVMGRVKEFNSITNLQTILSKEGFPSVKLVYLGGLWVMLELDNVESKLNLLQHVGVNSWFDSLQEAFPDFVSDDRVVWVDIEGIPLHIWSRDTFIKIGSKWGEVMDIEDNFGSSFARKRLCVRTKQPDSILEKFKVILRGKVYMARAKELFTWTPTFLEPKSSDYTSEDESVFGNKIQSDGLKVEGDEESDIEGVPDTIFSDNFDLSKGGHEEVVNQAFEDPFHIYDLLNKKPNDTRHVASPSVSHPPGFTPVDSEVREEVRNDEAIPDTGIVRRLHQTFEHWSMTQGAAEGFHNDNHLLLNNQFHGPQDQKVNRLELGGNLVYLRGIRRYERFVTDQIIIMHLGTCSLVILRSCARLFDKFISSSGLVDINLEGYTFTWSHPSASKMSRLDRFLVTEGFFSLFPSISALCLDRHLSDHMPILLREVNTDFGPTPFRFYHSWFSFDGFDKMVEDAWLSFSHSDSNRLVRFKKKLQALKSIIRQWVKDKRLKLYNVKSSLKKELSIIDKDLDSGNVSDSILLRRTELMSKLFDINQLENRDSIQKSKIQWAIEGDENSKFFHVVYRSSGRLDRPVSRTEIRKAVWSGGENNLQQYDARLFKLYTGSKLEMHSLNQPSIWCSIIREVRLLKDKGFDFMSHCKKRVGDGRLKVVRNFLDDMAAPVPPVVTKLVEVYSDKGSLRYALTTWYSEIFQHGYIFIRASLPPPVEIVPTPDYQSIPKISYLIVSISLVANDFKGFVIELEFDEMLIVVVVVAYREGLSSTQSVGPLGYECINENASDVSSMLLPETKSLNYQSISSAIPLSIPFDTTFFSYAAQENASMLNTSKYTSGISHHIVMPE
ncbi:RNA-directed DNA polymerase, eukaryota [Tanacetum coccineum]